MQDEVAGRRYGRVRKPLRRIFQKSFGKEGLTKRVPGIAAKARYSQHKAYSREKESPLQPAKQNLEAETQRIYSAHSPRIAFFAAC